MFEGQVISKNRQNVPLESPESMAFELFTAPRVIRLDRPVALLAGGLSRVSVTLSGWGLVRVVFRGEGGRRESSWKLFADRLAHYVVDIRPPGVLSISVINIFGINIHDWTLQTEFEVPAVISGTQVRRFPLLAQVSSAVPPLTPRATKFSPDRFRLPLQNLPESFWSSNNE
jgi:hypothetical protein